MGIFIPTKTKLFIFTRYQSSNIDINLRQNLNLVRVLLYLCVCNFFRVKKPSCKILKTKNCVPFEVQYTSSGFILSQNTEYACGGEYAMFCLFTRKMESPHYHASLN